MQFRSTPSKTTPPEPETRRQPEEIEPAEGTRARAMQSDSLRSVRSNRLIRLTAKVFAWLLIFVPIFLLLAPWRQNITGAGVVSALSPLDRQQPIRAAISGRLQEWYVQEGTKVVKGQKLFRIEDQDSDRLERLKEQLRQLRNKREAKSDKIANLNTTVSELRLTRDELLNAIEAEIENAEQKVQAAQKKLEATQAKRDFEQIRFDTLSGLEKKELAARLEVRDAEMELQVAEAEVQIAVNELGSARTVVTEKRAKLAATAAKENAEIEKALGNVSEATGELADIDKDIEAQESTIARQESQLAKAPRDGTVFRLLGGQGGEIVKAGDRILTFIPDQANTAVELWVDGNDAPLIHIGDPVRLQFEGWPAVQFVGWPSAAVGTYGGRVTLIDPAADSTHPGLFRVLVEPDPNDIEWPDSIYLRQGVQTKGWILLQEVSLGWELWRQLNGFPPVVALEQPKGKDGERVK